MDLFRFTWVLVENTAITQVNDTNDFELSKFRGTIDASKLSDLFQMFVFMPLLFFNTKSKIKVLIF